MSDTSQLDSLIAGYIQRAADDIMGGHELTTISRHRAESAMQRLAHQIRASTVESSRMGLLTVEEVAERFGVAGATARKWCQDGKLVAEKFGVENRATWLIAEESLAGFEPPSGGRPSK